MDQKTLEALAVMNLLAGQIESLKANASDFCAMLADENSSFVPGAGLATGKIFLRNTGEFYPVLGLDPSERAELAAVLQKYVFRIDGILSGCSIKLSQGIKEVMAEQEEIRRKFQATLIELKAKNEGGK